MMVSTVTTVDHAVESFVLSRDLMGCTPKTVKMYRDVMRDFLRSSPGWPVTVLDVQKYVGSMKTRGLKPYTINGRLRAMRAMCSWANQAGLLADNLGKAVRFKTPKTLPPLPTQDEVVRILRVAPKTWEGMRARTMVLVMVDTGLRVSELTGLRWEDVDATTQYLTVREGKGQKDRVVAVWLIRGAGAQSVDEPTGRGATGGLRLPFKDRTAAESCGGVHHRATSGPQGPTRATHLTSQTPALLRHAVPKKRGRLGDPPSDPRSLYPYDGPALRKIN